MLSHSDVLDAIDLKVDYLGSAASIEEHGIILESVNKYELCAEDSLEQGEWWPMVHCMYGLQACMSYTETSDAMSCSEAESGADDDVAIPGSDTTGLDSCVCTLELRSSKHSEQLHGSRGRQLDRRRVRARPCNARLRSPAGG